MGDAQPQERAIPTPEESGGSLRLSRRPGPPRGTGIPGVLREVRKSGGKIDSSRMIRKNQKLTIKNVSVDDSGVYECRGENNLLLSPVTHRFSLTVECK